MLICICFSLKRDSKWNSSTQQSCRAAGATESVLVKTPGKVLVGQTGGTADNGGALQNELLLVKLKLTDDTCVF